MRILFLFLNLIIASTLLSQRTEQELTEFINTSSKATLVKESSFLIMEGYYFDAERIIDKLLTIDPQSYNYNYRKGYVMMFSRDAYKEATPYFEKAAQKTRKNFDIYSAREKAASVDAIYYLGVCYHYQGRTDKAITQFNLFKEKSSKQSEFVRYADLRIKQCENAKSLEAAKKTGVVLKNLGGNVNSENSDYCASYSLDGSALFYTSRRPWGGDTSVVFKDLKGNQYLEDIYTSRIDKNSAFQKPERLGFNTPGNNEAVIAVIPNENMIFTFSEETGYGDIYYSKLEGNVFAKPTIFDVPGLNSEFWEAHAFITQNGSKMYFSSERTGGYGGRDLYEMEKLSNGEWSAPKNMGPGINSEFDEDSPFVSADGKYFFFASNGPKSMGGFDIMYAAKTSNGSWSESVNLGTPMNSFYDDIYYSATETGDAGNLSSSRPKGFGRIDIYEVQNNYVGLEDLSFLKAKIVTSDGSDIPENFRVVVTCLDCDEPSEKIFFPRKSDGKAITGLQPCKTYEISYQLGDDHKEIYKEKVQTKCNVTYSEVVKEYVLDVPKEKFIFPDAPQDNVKDENPAEFIKYFGYNKNEVEGLKEFNSFMRKVEDKVKNSKSVSIMILSSASRVPTKTFKTNDKLANLRAENAKNEIIDYLKSKNIDLKSVKIEIVESVVGGPKYIGDYKNQDKYAPFQFVKLTTK